LRFVPIWGAKRGVGPSAVAAAAIKVPRVKADIGLVAPDAWEQTTREATSRRRIRFIGLLLVLGLTLRLGTWRTYSGHHRGWQRHYLWEASGVELAVHVGIPLVFAVVVVLVAVWRAKPTRKAMADRQPSPFDSS
jgi:hypothetical protein